MRIGFREDYLHFLFEKKILGSSFVSTKGKVIDIIHFGERNDNAGPDFLDCVVRIDGQKWAGPIEFHLKASDWFKHKHQHDPTYDNVIAHFVYENDSDISTRGYELPAVELSEKIDFYHYQNYIKILNSNNVIPCSKQIGFVPVALIDEEKEKQLQKRLWYKSIEVLKLLEQYNGDVSKLKRVLLVRVFGGKVNQQPFEMLAEKITNRELRRLIGKDLEMEAFLFGRSNLLVDVKNIDDRFYELKRAYEHHCRLFGDQTIQLGWKYSRMRPSGFPDLKIAQLAKALARIQDMPSWQEGDIRFAFQNWLSFEMDAYWTCRYRLGGEQQKRKRHELSADFIDLILINAVVPYLFSIGYAQGREDLKRKAKELLKSIPPENNKIVRQWNRLKMNSESAYDSQSFLALQKQGCNQKKCLLCRIGKEVLNK